MVGERRIINCSIGIMAYNEEKNIGLLLDALAGQKLKEVKISRIFVVASGCTDRTEEIVRQKKSSDQRINLICQKKREGKAAAVNEFLKKTEGEILVLISADTLPAGEAIERLVSPFKNPEIGMTGGQIKPTNPSYSFMGFASHLLWGLHHKISLKRPKMGEMVAFRKIFQRIPYASAVDEANIEPLIMGQGYQIKYVPESVVYNKGPETVSDFIRQRRRIYAGHLVIKEIQGYSVATLSPLRILWVFLQNYKFTPRYFFFSPIVIFLEIYSRYLGRQDFRRKKTHTIWEMVSSTKKVDHHE